MSRWWKLDWHFSISIQFKALNESSRMWHYKMNYCVMCLQQFETNINNGSQKSPHIKWRANTVLFSSIMCSSRNPELNCLCPQRWHIHPHSSTVILEYSQPKIALLFSSLEGKRVVNYNFVLITLITVKMCSSWWHWQEHKPLLCFSLMRESSTDPLPTKNRPAILHFHE